MKHISLLFSSGYAKMLSSCQKIFFVLFSSLCNIFQSLINITQEKYDFSHYYAIRIHHLIMSLITRLVLMSAYVILVWNHKIHFTPDRFFLKGVLDKIKLICIVHRRLIFAIFPMYFIFCYIPPSILY